MVAEHQPAIESQNHSCQNSIPGALQEDHDAQAHDQF